MAAISQEGGGNNTRNDPSPASSSDGFFGGGFVKAPVLDPPRVEAAIVGTGGGDKSGQHQLRRQPAIAHSMRMTSGYVAPVPPGSGEAPRETPIGGHTSLRMGFIIAHPDHSAGSGKNPDQDKESSDSNY